MFIKKILCLGSNIGNTDVMVSDLAKVNSTTNHGLISDSEFIPTQSGLYHTTVVDITPGGIINMSKHFDEIWLLDQPTSEWDHWKLLSTSFRVMENLDKLGVVTNFRNNKNIQKFIDFGKFLADNKSFCIYPWINFTESRGNVNVCARSTVKVTTAEEIVSWKDDPKFIPIRQNMLKGITMPDFCNVCYEYESRGVESYRQYETKEWISKLEIDSIEDLEKITHPYYYEIRLSNKCNLMCRSCKPEFSHLIEREARQHKIGVYGKKNIKYSSLDRIPIDTLSRQVRVYLTGGEPTVMSEVYDFMRQCIAAGKTDFDFTLGTNGFKINDTFIELCDHFSNLNFSVSLDGYGHINDYWRWNSKFDDIVRNMKILQSRGHNININCVPGIYNVTNLHLLYEFLDQEFPKVDMYLQLNYNPIQSVWNHPNAELVVESMKRCQQTRLYYADGKSNKTTIDRILHYYSNNPGYDVESLRQFFDYNDQLDRARNSRLGDYIPELEACRSLITAR